jgi:hypothetical protein
MGGAASKPEDIVAVANAPVSYSPPLGPPVRVRFVPFSALTLARGFLRWCCPAAAPRACATRACT